MMIKISIRKVKRNQIPCLRTATTKSAGMQFLLTNIYAFGLGRVLMWDEFGSILGVRLLLI